MSPTKRLAMVSRYLASARTGRAVISLSRQTSTIRSMTTTTRARNPPLRRPYSTSFAEHRKTATQSDTPTILCDTKTLPNGAGNVATVTVSNPSKLNIVNTPLFQQMLSTFQTLSRDESLRVVILTGAKTHTKSQAFIGGADINEMFALDTPDLARTFISGIHDVCTAIRTLPVPVIAKIDGFCLGAGLEIMAACDLRVASKNSIFGMPELKVGIPCVVEARLLCDLVGWGRARRLIYLAENIDSGMAETWGLVEAVVADKAALDETTAKWVEMIAGMGPVAVRAQKVLNKAWEEGTVDQGIEAGVECFANSFADGGAEPKKMMGAFVNRKR